MNDDLNILWADKFRNIWNYVNILADNYELFVYNFKTIYVAMNSSLFLKIMYDLLISLLLHYYCNVPPSHERKERS